MAVQAENPEGALIKTIANSDLTNVTANLTEVALDQILKQGLLRDIPIVGSIVGVGRAVVSISNHLFLKKVFRFLAKLNDVSPEERAEFVEKLETDAGQRQKVGEKLILLLDRFDDLQKADLLGKIFKAYIKGTIDYIKFQKLSTALENMGIHNLPELKKYYGGNIGIGGIDEQALQEFAFAGLVRLQFTGAIGGASGYQHSDLGKLFIEIVLADGA